jgi:hypothetical protein
MNRITAGIAFILGVGAGWIVTGSYWDVLFTSYLPALATLLAAFYGAKYAFEFQRRKEAEDKKKKDLVSANIAIYTLMRMANALLVFRKQVIDPFRGRPTAFLEIPAVLHPVGEDIKINSESLYFLLETKELNLLAEILIEEERYKTAIRCINERSDLHRNEIQPLLERAGLKEKGFLSMTQIEEILGSRLFVTLNTSTDQIIDHVDQTITSIQIVSTMFYDCIKRIYPDDQIIRYSFPV